MKKSKILKVMLTCVLAITVLACTVLLVSPKAEAATEGYYTYTVSGGKATITDCNTSIRGDITIPSTLGGYLVTGIGYQAFNFCTSLKSVTIPGSVTSIGTYAFYNCSNLTSVTIPDSVTSIGDYAFHNCSSLTDVYITDPNAWCKINFGGSYANPMSYRGFLHILDDNGNEVTELVLDNTVTAIPSYAFRGSAITAVTIPDSITSIGDVAFCDCDSLTSVTIGDSVTSIGDYAFYDCTSLESVTIGDSVTSIGDYAFDWCTSLTSVTIGNSVTSIGDDAFSFCKALTSVTIPDSVTSIGYAAFSGCSSLGSVTIPDSVTSIGEGAFFNCTSLTSVTIPDSVESIGNYAFSYCYSLESVTIGNSVTGIGYRAFYYCRRLTSVTIPDSVTSIGDEAFDSCSSLTDVYYAGTQSQWESISIGSYNERLTSATVHYQHIHDYTLFPSVTVDPTCTQNGYTEYTCVWGDTDRQTISALGHNYTVFVETVAPTCLTEGYTTYKCSRCTATNTDYVEALDHDYTVLAETVAPTCLDGGYSVYRCVRCEETQTRDQVSALGHDYSGTVTLVEPTCKDQGYTGTQCIRCDSIQKTNITNVVAHKLAILPAVDPTCTEPGLTLGTACKWCGMVGVAQKEVAALGGNCDFTADPTTCSNCGYVRADVVITNVVLRPSCSGLYFKGGFTFGTHETVSRYGIAVSLYNNLPVADDSDATSLYTVGENSVLISNILGEGKNGRDLIYARPYVLLDDGTYIYGDVVVTNLKSVVETIDLKLDTLTTAQQTVVADLYRQNTAAMQDWLIPKIKEFA